MQDGIQYHMEIYESIFDASALWDEVLNGRNTLLSSDYLKALERFPPVGMKFRYLLLRDAINKPVGIVYFQIQHFNAAQSLNEAENNGSPWFIGSLQKFFKGVVAKTVVFNTFVCGNLLLTGENGYFFSNSISDDEILTVVSAASEKVQQQLNEEGIQCNVCLMKDFKVHEQQPSGKVLGDKRFHEFTVQPCMMMYLNSSWVTFDDYLADLHSKYRMRAKRAFKKSSGLICTELKLEQIQKYQDDIHKKYLMVADNAGFNTVNLHPEYFYGLKKFLGERFRLFAYFREDKLQAFYTIIHNGHEVEAHFLGYDREENAKSQIYLNSLFDIVRLGIEGRFQQINFSRTALEIKSSVGAVPQEMYCYMKHRSNISNKFIKPVIDYLNPDFSWTPRHPFK